MLSTRQTILNIVEDMITDFLYYDRKEDEELPVNAIEDAIQAGDISEAEIVAEFATQLKKGLS